MPAIGWPWPDGAWELLEEVAAQSGAGARALAVRADVADEDSVAALFAKTKETFGRLGPPVQQRRGRERRRCRWKSSRSRNGSAWWTSTSPARSCVRNTPFA